VLKPVNLARTKSNILLSDVYGFACIVNVWFETQGGDGYNILVFFQRSTKNAAAKSQVDG